MEGYHRAHPPYVPQLAVPTTVPQNCFKAALLSTDTIVRTVGFLAIIAFFYLMCVGRYTKPQYVIRGGKRVRDTQTQQFLVGDVGFFKDVDMVPRSLPVKLLLTSDSTTLKNIHYKNN